MGLSIGKKCSIFSSNRQLWKCILHFSCYLYHLITWFYQIRKAPTQGYQIGKFSFFGNTANWEWLPSPAVQVTSWFTSPLMACRVIASWLPVHWLPGCIMITCLLANLIHEGSHYKCSATSPSFIKQAAVGFPPSQTSVPLSMVMNLHDAIPLPPLSPTSSGGLQNCRSQTSTDN